MVRTAASTRVVAKPVGGVSMQPLRTSWSWATVVMVGTWWVDETTPNQPTRGVGTKVKEYTWKGCSFAPPPPPLSWVGWDTWQWGGRGRRSIHPLDEGGDTHPVGSFATPFHQHHPRSMPHRLAGKEGGIWTDVRRSPPFPLATRGRIPPSQVCHRPSCPSPRFTARTRTWKTIRNRKTT